MPEYIALELVWSIVGFLLGYGAGWLTSDLVKEGLTMTTPERLRRRQRIESAMIAVLAVCLVAATLYFSARSDRQQACMRAFIDSSSDTQEIRAELNERESEATQRVIQTGLSVKSAEELIAVREQYNRSLSQIAKARKANPVERFSADECE